MRDSIKEEHHPSSAGRTLFACRRGAPYPGALQRVVIAGAACLFGYAVAAVSKETAKRSSEDGAQVPAIPGVFCIILDEGIAT
ncbi:hypothetical protein Hsero_2930 [Herbaspirillum seropedicae SmR1]|uniref:Uncharacterized protein n=1 Tax=Herbaspirillum seropedicae (strain SmR1) TaxID=757424 RepID=D8IZS9_HERSS|nr:hypothetical protein Hsero_2930 [Herbaspirillum seropedicae SmR1]